MTRQVQPLCQLREDEEGQKVLNLGALLWHKLYVRVPMPAGRQIVASVQDLAIYMYLAITLGFGIIMVRAIAQRKIW